MTIPNDFELSEMTEAQSDKYLTHNTDNRRLSVGIGGRLTHNFTADANYTLDTATGAEEWRYKFITLTDTTSPLTLTAGRDVIFPSKKGPEYIIKNSTAQTLTLKISGQTGVTIAAGVTGRYYYDATDIVAGP